MTFPLFLIVLILIINFTRMLHGETINLHNWGGNFMFSTQNIQYPRTAAQVQQIVKRACKLRVLGSRHSFSTIADSADTILSTLGMNNIISLDKSVPSVTVQGGISYRDLVPFLHNSGFALPMLAGLDDISVAGASQTGTHGSGLGNSNLATQIRSLQLVLANGSVATFGPSDPRLRALAVGLGAFGVITQVELNLVPTFNVTNYVFTDMPAENYYKQFDKIQKMGYSVNSISYLTNNSVFDQIAITVRSDQENNVGNLNKLFGATKAARSTTETILENEVEMPWYKGLVWSYPIGLSRADGNEQATEYFVPYAKAVPALKAVIEVVKLQPQIRSLFGVLAIRTIKGDNLWMSPQGGGDFVAINLNFKNNMTALEQLLPIVEKALLKFDARPHWGKLFTMKPKNFLNSYEKLNDFKNLAEQFDPTKKFRNKFLKDNVFLDK